MAEEWSTHENEDGVPYYHNASTNETTWTKPAALQSGEVENGKDEVTDGNDKASPKSLSLTVRTLAGKEFSVDSLTTSSTVIDLKKAIYSQNDDFSPEYQRLLLHGHGLGEGDDTKTLGDCGVDGTTPIHLVRRLRGSSFSSSNDGSQGGVEGGVVKPQNPGSITLIVPENVRGGQVIAFMKPGTTQRCQVRVPEGLNPGDRFTVRIPESNGYTPNPQQQQQQQAQGGALMEVVCPANTAAGQQIEVMTVRGRVRVVVPPGIFPGMKFRFRLPN